MAISPPEEPHMRWRSSTGRSSNGQDQHGQQARQPQRGGAVLLVVALRLGPPVDVQRGRARRGPPVRDVIPTPDLRIGTGSPDRPDPRRALIRGACR